MIVTAKRASVIVKQTLIMRLIGSWLQGALLGPRKTQTVGTAHLQLVVNMKEKETEKVKKNVCVDYM